MSQKHIKLVHLLNRFNNGSIAFVCYLDLHQKMLYLQVKQENTVYMAKTLLTILFTTALFVGSPLASRANSVIEFVDNDFQKVVITVSESTIHVAGGAGQMLAIYDLAGVRVAYLKIDSAEKHFDLGLPKGCYIIKVGKVVRKIAIR